MLEKREMTWFIYSQKTDGMEEVKAGEGKTPRAHLPYLGGFSRPDGLYKGKGFWGWVVNLWPCCVSFS